jgi:hypothetical protein
MTPSHTELVVAIQQIKFRGNDVNELQSIGEDRRNDKRYGMQLRLRWKLVRRRRVIDSGMGQTIDMSSGGILFDAGSDLPVGLNVELAIAWPMLLREVTPMQLIVTGRILRSGDGRTAIRTVTHEFRTLGVPLDQRGAPTNSGKPPGTLLHMANVLAPPIPR